jgi:hypothetical protein
VDRGDLSASLGLGSLGIGGVELEMLTPAPSDGAVDGKPAHPDAESQTRRRSRMEREKERKLDNDGDQDQPEAASPVHQLDHLA